MTPEERNLITGLFDRLRQAEAGAPAKDREAEDLIRQLTSQAPSAPYLLTQTLLVQEHALANAQARIQTLERQAAQVQQPAQSSGGGFLSGLFGHSSTPTPAAPQQQAPPPMPVQPQSMPYPTTMGMAPSAGGGFLRSALSTAAGVAGGAALFQGIESLLGHNAGPFGGGLGGFGGGGTFVETGGPREVVNNYYNAAPTGEHEHSGGGAGGGDIPAGAADQPAHPGYEDARFDDSSFNNSNPFDQPANDSNLLNTGSDNSSLDNNYDLDNTDSSESSDFGGGDFVGNDNSGDDSSTV